MAAEGQPESIVQDIETMVRTYVEKVIEESLAVNFLSPITGVASLKLFSLEGFIILPENFALFPPLILEYNIEMMGWMKSI